MRARPGFAAVLVALLAATAAGAEPAPGGVVRGRIELGVAGARMADLGPLVVYLDAPEDGARLDFAVPAAVPGMRQKDVRFRPRLLVVTAGQRVALPNDDAIYHNVFSFSRPNDFDLGLYPQGESRSVVLRHPGVVRIYCSIHESMSGTILVVPSPWHAIADASGGFEIRGVPAGRYRLWIWNDRLPRVVRRVRVDADGVTSLVVPVGAEQEPPSTPAPAGKS